MTDSAKFSDRDSIRAADSDRERVVALLSKASGEGRISLAEFEERSGQVYAAKSYADLDRLVEDLPEEWQADKSLSHGRTDDVEHGSRPDGIFGGWWPSNARLVEMSLGPFSSKNRRKP